MIRNKFFIFIFCFGFIYSSGSFNYGGKVNYYYISRFLDQEVLNLPFRLFNFNFQYSKDAVDVNADFALEFLLKDDTFYLENNNSQDFTPDMREMFITWYSNAGELSIGKKIHSWGNADENSPLDVVSPIDYLYLFESGADRKLGIYSLSFDGFVGDGFKYGFVLSPLHNTHRLPRGYKDFPIQVPLPNAYRIMEVPKSHPEFGAYLQQSFDLADIRFSYFTGYDRTFSFTGLNLFTESEVSDNPTELDTVYSYRKTQVLGFGTTILTDYITIRADLAMFETNDPYSNISRENPQPWLYSEILGGYVQGVPNELDHVFVTYPWNQSANYSQATIQLEAALSEDATILLQYFYHKVNDYNSNLPLEIYIPQEDATIIINPEDYFFPGLGSSLAILTSKAMTLNLDFKIDGFNSLSLSGLYDINKYGRLFSLEYTRNILSGFDFKLGVTKIIGNDNAPLDNLGQEYRFNAMEDFSHLRMQFYYAF